MAARPTVKSTAHCKAVYGIPRRAGPTTAFGRVVGRQAYTKICAAAMGIAAPIELQRSSGFIIPQLAVDVR